jgi:tetratricopeptide (TPR) repeat protein
MTTVNPVETLYGLGHWLLEQGREADAIHVFRTMLVTAPEDERPWLGLGLCHERQERDDTARQLYTLGQSAARGSFRCPLARARLLRKADLAHLAEEAYELAEERATAMGEHDHAASIAVERASSW